MRWVHCPAATAVVVAFGFAVADASAGEKDPTGPAHDAFAAAFGELADGITPQSGTRPGPEDRRFEGASAVTGAAPRLRLARPPTRTEDFEAALERLKDSESIGLRDAYGADPDRDSLGLRIPLSEKTAIVPTYDVERRDIGMSGTDDDRAHRFRIGASWRF